MDSGTTSRLPCYACGAAVGLLLALATLPLDFIGGNHGFWEQPKHDFYAYTVAWNYFIQDDWRLPLLDVPAMGYPEGGNLIYSDALPIAQIGSKAVHSALGLAVNPLGWWILLTYLLQGAMAARVVRAAGVRSPLGWIAAAILATATVPFMTRIFHVALSSHFLILWALALYLENTRDRRFTALEHAFLSTLTLLTSAYLFVMVGVLQTVTVAVLWSRNALTRRNVGAIAAGMAAVLAAGLLIGYGRFLVDPGSMRAGGFGILSWNPASLVLAPDSHWDYVAAFPRIVRSEQGEGESYIGLGALIVVAVILIARPRQAISAIARHRLFSLVLGLFLLYAISNRVFLGPHLILEVPLPDAAERLVSFFRASARFVWVPMYALVLLSLSALLKWCPKALAIPVVLVAIVAQLSEARSTVLKFRPQLATPWEDRLDVGQFRRWLSRHQRLFQFPSFSCQPPRTPDDTFREFQIELVAARLNVPTNSLYTARQLKDCAAEALWAVGAELDPTTLYVLNKTAIPQFPPLALLRIHRSVSTWTGRWSARDSR